MTLKELSQLYYLNREIARYQKQLASLEASAYAPATSKLTGMPMEPHFGDGKTARCATEIVDLKAIIAAKQIQCIYEQSRLERYIADIPDSQTRLIFQYRFVNGLTWDRVARNVGGMNTKDSVKKRCYRYLRENS